MKFLIGLVFIAGIAAKDDDDLCQTTGICDHVMQSVRDSFNTLCTDDCTCDAKLQILTEGEVWKCLMNEDCAQQPAGTDPSIYAR